MTHVNLCESCIPELGPPILTGETELILLAAGVGMAWNDSRQRMRGIWKDRKPPQLLSMGLLNDGTSARKLRILEQNLEFSFGQGHMRSIVARRLFISSRHVRPLGTDGLCLPCCLLQYSCILTVKKAFANHDNQPTP